MKCILIVKKWKNIAIFLFFKRNGKKKYINVGYSLSIDGKETKKVYSNNIHKFLDKFEDNYFYIPIYLANDKIGHIECEKISIDCWVCCNKYIQGVLI